jgi:hypothetical protein
VYTFNCTFFPLCVWPVVVAWSKRSYKSNYNALSGVGCIIGARIIVIYTISGIKAILQDSSVKIADDEGVSPSSSVITRVSCNML